MRDAPVIGRSPVKNNAFRTLRTGKKKWCVCGKPLIYLKDSEAWTCGECGRTEYLQQPEQQQQIQQQQGIGGVMSVDGLSDVRTSPNGGAMKFRSKDPRSRFLKQKREIDPELERILENAGATLVSYNERVEEDSQVVSSNELRDNK